MKKIIITIFLIIISILLIPIVFTKSFKTKETLSEKENSLSIEDYNYGQYNKIKLLHTDSGEIEELSLDEYLYGVVSSEMPANFETEALKAQAIVARTYTIYNIKNNTKHENANICDKSSCCQAWISKADRLAKWNEADSKSNWEKITNAVDSTEGKIITYEGEPINSFFHSNSGGITETAESVWGGDNYPYLQTVETYGENEYSQYSSELVITKQDLIDKIKQYHNDIEIDFKEEDAIKILEYTSSGRVSNVKFGNLNLSGKEIRNIFSLKSTNFLIDVREDDIKFTVIGYGHGVGMSQTGADYMAKQGGSYEDIINHFYTGVQISNL